MGFLESMNNKIKNTIRAWLNVQNSSPYTIQIDELLDFELNAIRNKIWYRGDGNELEQLYAQVQEFADKYKFWASKSSPGMEIRKIHTGLPGLLVDILSSVVLSDMNDFEFEDVRCESLWKEMLLDNIKDNKFDKLLEKALKDCLVVGDGAFKISIDTSISKYPLIEWVSGEYVEIVKEKGRLKEIIFKSGTRDGCVLFEHYGKGYIKYSLYKNGEEIDFRLNKHTKDLVEYEFSNDFMLATTFKIYQSKKFENRGGSIYDSKVDSFDSLDEVWSQWMDAQRAGRTIRYIPDSLLPRNPYTGEIMNSNSFDNRYIKTDSDMGESARNEITYNQAIIQHDSYLSTYVTALDLCLQGIVSPSTLGIDVKKLDNAEAQREKEKTTLYTRNAIIKAIQDHIPDVVATCINAYNLLNNLKLEEVRVNIPFGEYANPSFESQVETVGKGKTQGIMSIEACIEELYGDTKTDEWKKEEIKRLKSEQGIEEVDEPSLNTDGVLISE